MNVSTSIPNLINGVSQQADALRYPSQCDEQLNYFPSVTRGLTKRPPTEHRALVDLAGSEYLIDKINRSDSERYTLALGNRSVVVLDKAGMRVPVLTESGTEVAPEDLLYLSTAQPKKHLKALTVADYVFLLNKSVTTAQLPAVSPKRQPEAIVMVMQIRQGASYSIRLYGKPSDTAPFAWASVSSIETNPEASEPVGPLAPDQGALAALLVGQLALGSEWVLSHSGGLIYIAKKAGDTGPEADFRVEVESTISDGMRVVKDTIASFSMLPERGWPGFTTKVSSDPESASDDYYVSFRVRDDLATGVEAFAEGAWVESQRGGLKDAIDPSTMPHALLNYGTHFVFKRLDWDTRKSGDDQTNGAPSFVGSMIRDIGFLKNRLVLLAGENAVLSESGHYFNFWRTTVIQLLDTDVIDTAASHTRVSTLHSLFSVGDRTLVTAEATQFMLDSGEALSPKTTALPHVTDFETIPDVAPRSLGNSAYFPFLRGGFSGFYEYAVEPETGQLSADDVTEHVPLYLIGKVTAFDLSDTLNLLVAQTDRDASTLYLYNFFKRGGQRLQSAWSKLVFSGDVVGFYILDSSLHLFIRRGTETSYEVMRFTALADDGVAWLTHLDRRITESACVLLYDASRNRTSLTLPYTPTAGVTVATRQTGTTNAGAKLPIVLVEGRTITVQGDQRKTSLWLGETYRSEYVMSRPTIRQQRNDGTYRISNERFQVRYGTISVSETLSLRSEVFTVNRKTPFSYPYVTRRLNTQSAVSGSSLVPASTPFRFPVFSKSDQVRIKLINDDFLPCNLLAAEWDALYVMKTNKL